MGAHWRGGRSRLIARRPSGGLEGNDSTLVQPSGNGDGTRSTYASSTALPRPGLASLARLRHPGGVGPGGGEQVSDGDLGVKQWRPA